MTAFAIVQARFHDCILPPERVRREPGTLAIEGNDFTTFLQTFDGPVTTFVPRRRRLAVMKTTLLTLILVAAPCRIIAGNGATENYVAHEWGTFTSVQGADGILIPWNPLETSKLPKFVYDWTKPGMNRLPSGVLNPGSKSAFVTLQRMETPVIYLYSETERRVDVAVRFPQGLITEWYPQATEIGPSSFPPGHVATALDGWVRQAGLNPHLTFASLFGKKGVPDSRIHWTQLRVLPAKGHAELSKALPTDVAGSHYLAARETDAAFLRVNSSETGKPAEQEKFLFYRGVANFKAPLSVTMGGGGEEWFQLRNTGTAELRHLFILNVQSGKGEFTQVDRLSGGELRSIHLAGKPNRAPLQEAADQLSQQMKEALSREGLYEREATAMVKTWRESWFEEEGVRVIYTLPRAWADEILPLTLDPKPRENVRVMVGRAEIIRPTTKWELLKQIVRYAEGDSAGKQQAITRVQGLRLGRFIQPAVQCVLGSHPSPEFSQAAWALLNAATKARDDKSLAAR